MAPDGSRLIVPLLLAYHPTFRTRAVKHKHHKVGFHTSVDNRALDLRDPLRHQRHWHYNQRALERRQVRKDEPHHHHGLSKPHLVSDDTASDASSSTRRRRRARRAFTAQAELNTFALVCLRFKTGFLYIFVKPVNTCLRDHSHSHSRSFLHNDSPFHRTKFQFHFRCRD